MKPKINSKKLNLSNQNLRIIPKLDIKNENLVKGVHLEGLRVLGNPKSFAHKYYLDGADEIIYHDVVASLYQRNSLDNLIKKTSEEIFIPLLVGGGISSLSEVENKIKNGADRVFLNTAAIDKPKLIKDISKKFGSSTAVLSIEVVKVDNEYFCRKDFGREHTSLKMIDWIKKVEDYGIGEILITSIDRDGTGKGFDLKIVESLEKFVRTPYLLNGGFSQYKHFSDILNVGLPSGFVMSSILHYNYINKLNYAESKIDGNNTYLDKKIRNQKFKNYSIKDIKKYLTKKHKIVFRN